MTASEISAETNSGTRSVRKYWVLAVLSLTTLMVFLDGTVVNTATPAIARDFTANNSTLQWIVNAYGLILAGFLLVGGSIGDRYGRRLLLAGGMVVFALGAVGAALSENSSMLIGMRGVQGLGAAMALPSTLSIITDVFPRGERARAIAIWTGVSAIGIAIGPAAGGVLVDEIGWEAVFWLQIPFIVAILIGTRMIPESKDSRREPIDLPGGVLGTAGIIAVVFAIIQGGEFGWTSVEILASFIIGGLLLVGFAIVELRSSHPMLPIRYLRDKQILGPFVVLTILFLGMMGVFFFMSQFLQIVQGRSAIVSGMAIVPVAGSMMVAAGISSKLLPKVGPRAIVVIGIVIVLIATGFLAQVSVDQAYWVSLVGILIMGLGAGLVMPTVSDTLMASVDVDDAGVGSALNDLGRELGVALGVAILGTFVTNFYRNDIVDGLRGLIGADSIDRIGDSIVAAVPETAGLPADTAAQVIAAANDSFVSALQIGYWGAFGFVAVALVVGVLMMPSKMRVTQVENEHEDEMVPVLEPVIETA